MEQDGPDETGFSPEDLRHASEEYGRILRRAAELLRRRPAESLLPRPSPAPLRRSPGMYDLSAPEKNDLVREAFPQDPLVRTHPHGSLR